MKVLRHAILLGMAALPLTVSAVMPRTYEYWFDSASQEKTKGALSGDALQLNLPVGDLEKGIHFFNLRVVDEAGEPGPLYRTIFYVPPKPVDASAKKYELWTDDAFSRRKIIPVSQSGALAYNLDVSALQAGLHFLNVRPLSADGEPGVLYRTMFYIAPTPDADVRGYEYSIDGQDPVAVDAVVSGSSLSLSVDVSGLENGEHTFRFRARNSLGTWGEEYVEKFTLTTDRTPLDKAEWERLVMLVTELKGKGWTRPWDISGGSSSAYGFEGLTLRDGKVCEICLPESGLSGSFPKSFAAFPDLVRLDLADNDLDGNLGIAASMQSLTSLNVEGNRFESVIPPLPARITDLNMGRQRIRKTVDVNFSDIDLVGMMSQVPDIVLYDHENSTYRRSLRLQLVQRDGEEYRVPTENEWYANIGISGSGLEIVRVSEKNDYHGESGDIVRAFVVGEDGATDGTTMPVSVRYAAGDANFFGGVDATDLQATILYAFEDYRRLPFNFTAADTYRDDRINVQDVVKTVDILLENPLPQGRNAVRKAPGCINDISVADRNGMAGIQIVGSDVVLTTPRDVAAIVVKASGDIVWDVKRLGLTQRSDDTGLVGYSLGTATIPAGETVIGHAVGSVRITAVSLSDSEALPIEVKGFDPESGVDAIFGDPGVPEAFDLLGRPSSGDAPGVTILRKGGRYEKKVKLK